MENNLNDEQIEVNDIFYRGTLEIESNSKNSKNPKNICLIIISIIMAILIICFITVILIICNQNDYEILNNEIENLKNSNQNSKSKIENLKNSTQNSKTEIDDLKKLHENSKNLIDDIKNSVKDSKSEIENLKQFNENSENLIDDLKNSVKDSKNEIENLKQLNKNSKIEITELKLLNINSKSEIENLKQLNENSKIEIGVLKSLNENSKNEIDDLKKFKEISKNEIDDLKIFKENSKSEINNLKSLNENSKREIDGLSSMQDEYTYTSNLKFENLTNCISRLEKDFKELKNTINYMKMKKNVLLISDYNVKKKRADNYKTTDYLYLLLSKVNFVALYVIDSLSVQKYTLENFKKYSAVVFDLLEYGYIFTNLTFSDEIANYVKNGGSVFATHDQFENKNNKLKYLLNIFGLEYYSVSSAIKNKAKVCNSAQIANAKVCNKNHSIFYNYYNLTNLNDFSVQETKRCFSKINVTSSAIKLIDLVINNKQTVDYLVVNKYEKGKTAKTLAENRIPMTLDEEKIFINTLHWLLFDEN